MASGVGARDPAWGDAETTSAAALLVALEAATGKRGWQLRHGAAPVPATGAALAAALAIPPGCKELVIHAELPEGASSKRRREALEETARRGTTPEAERARRHLSRREA